MSIVINTNVQSLVAQRALYKSTVDLNRSTEKLSTGLRINRAADDAAGLSISENLIAQARGSKVAQANAQDANNLLQTTDGDLSVITDHLHRIRDLAVQAGNDTNNTEARDAIQSEIDARIAEISRIANASEFSGIQLLDGSAGQLVFQIGANATDTVSAESTLFASVNATALGISNLGVASAGSAQDTISLVDGAISDISTQRGNIGALQNRLDGIVQSLAVKEENLSAANSRIRDTDIATEAAKLTKAQILQASSISLLSQANQSPAIALTLI